MGVPKALMEDTDGTGWLERSVRVLHAGGCDEVTVVLGAEADRAARLLDGMLPAGPDRVVADDWDTGMGASLRAGLAALTERSGAAAAVVHLVDLPDVTAEVVRRLLTAGATPDVLSRVTYQGVLGHPVLLGRDHWAGVTATARGDRGARDYLAAHPVVPVECGDLATGRDVDTPAGG